jgi:hypothetical protein
MPGSALRAIALYFVVQLGGCAWSDYGYNLYEAPDTALVGQSKGAFIERFGVPDFHLVDPAGSAELWGYSVKRSRYWLVFGRTRGSGVLVWISGDKVQKAFRVDQATFDEVATRGWKYAKFLTRH